MTLDIDRVLTEDAETWQAGLPPGPGPGAVFGEQRRPGGHPHRILAVAASVTAILVIAGVVLGVHWGSSTRAASVGPHFSGPCQANFVATPSTYQPAPPPAFQKLRVTLTYRGSSPCRVSAYGPYLELRDVNGELLGTGQNSELIKLEPGYLVVQPGDSLALTMRWTAACGSRARVATVILHLDGKVNTPGVGVAVQVSADYSPACERHARPFTGAVEPPKLIVGLTAAQRALALQIAHQEAIGSIPGGTTVTHGFWPANVESVSAIVTTATDGAHYVGGSTSVNGEVLVVRLTGRFSLVTSGPPGSGNATGNELTALVPLATERVTDGGVETHHPPADLPNSTVLFTR